MANSISMWRTSTSRQQQQLSPAIVVLVGWWGAKPRHLDKYQELYQDLLPGCTVVAGTADSLSILYKNDRQLREFAEDGLATVASVMEHSGNPHLPILIHLFSNGGGFVWQHMLKCLDDQDPRATGNTIHRRIFQRLSGDDRRHTNLSISSVDTEGTPLHTNTALSRIRENIQGQVYDSSPGYPTILTVKAALEGSGLGSQSRLLLFLLQSVVTILYGFESVWNWIRRRPHRMVQYWNDLEQSDLQVPQAFVYSTVDRMIDPQHLSTFIQARQQRLGSNVYVLPFEDSPHIQHFRHHPEKCREFLKSFVQVTIV